MKKSYIEWDEVFSEGKRTRSGIFNYIQQPEYAGEFLNLLSQYGLSAEKNMQGIYFHPEYMGMMSHRYFYKELRYMLSGNDWTGKHKFVKNHIENLFKPCKENEEEIIFLLLRVLVAAEIRFASKYIPQNSHEERLTGHLLSELIFCLDLAKKEFLKTCRKLFNTEFDLDFHYADVATNSNEAKSGADFGVILIADLPNSPKIIKAFKFQAKKANPSATIDIKQMESLISGGDEGAFYLFYCMQNEKSSKKGCLSPVVLNAQRCKNAMSTKKNEQKTFTLSKDVICKETIPFAAFLMLEGLNPDNNIGHSCSSLEAAARYIYSYEENYRVSRVMVVSVGAGPVPKEPDGGPNDDFSGNFLFRYPRGH